MNQATTDMTAATDMAERIATARDLLGTKNVTEISAHLADIPVEHRRVLIQEIMVQAMLAAVDHPEWSFKALVLDQHEAIVS